MMSSTNKYDQIIKYIEGEMSSEEKVAFESEMAKNPELAEEVEVEQVSMRVMEYHYIQEMSEIIKEQQTKKTKKIKWSSYYLGGLLFIGIVLSGFYYLNRSQTKMGDVRVVENDQLLLESATVVDESNTVNIKTLPVNSSNEPKQKSSQQEKHNETINENDLIAKETSLEVINDLDSTLIVEKVNETKEEKEVVDSTREEAKVNVKEDEIVENKTTSCGKNPTVNIEVNTIYFDSDNGGELLIDSDNDELLFSLNGKTFSEDREYEFLDVGSYEVRSKDTLGCVFEHGRYLIKKVNCLKEKNIGFNIRIDQELRIPILDEETEITIFNKSSKLIYNESLSYEEAFLWSGGSNNGSSVEFGLHKVIVNGNSQTCVYNVVIEN